MRNALLAATLLLASLGEARAQATFPVRLGDRVRVYSPFIAHSPDSRWGAAIEGTVVAVDADSVRVETKRDTPPATVAIAAVVRVEVLRGKTSAGGRGAALGALSGALAGVIIAFASEKPCPAGEGLCVDVISPGARVAGGAVVGAGLGALAGFAIGSLVRVDRWEVLSVGPARSSLTPRTGLSLAFAARFSF